ncbi:flavin-containing monooxygenase [Zhongshania aliphaticivorans]|uniref:flavin-containing monooxygenase n=1 Tax=Zhongshania aliphaticivorans TaxID=1470434 RepID=UPI0012E49036|nr:NAD(P)/FAD-dependent oxidoreductase [Zhongshania aliphaticivorans]CAA0110296.1 Baeyer-Villiger monooxygenase [Zhongshania aliphaticivorans]
MANSNDASDVSYTNTQILIVGTGFAGLGMAIRLKEMGINDFIIIERAKDVGGTWRDNRYPGAACDVPSHLYSFSFEPNADWSRVYPTQPELETYLQNVANKWQLRPHIRFDHTLNQARYDEKNSQWLVNTSGGNFKARFVISGNGGLAEPKLPDIPGVESFAGHHFHSANWDHSYTLPGKRVAVIGTGASAIQFVPEIAGVPAKLSIFQRTPNWIIPRGDRPYSRIEKWIFKHIPITRKILRAKIYCQNESRVLGMVLHPSIMGLFRRSAMKHIQRQVSNPALRPKLTPSFPIGCKRILVSNDWYPALQKPNVEVVTNGIKEIREHSIVTNDNVEHEVDCIIFGTGFYATDNPIAGMIYGRDGRQLSQVWKDGEEAYLGASVHGFPNFFFIVGPNVTLGHSSMVYMIETQVQAISRILLATDENNAATVEVKLDVQQSYNEKLQKLLGGSIWATGCDSWYKHRTGKITQLWPGFTFTFRRWNRDFKHSDYLFNSVEK